jgi:uncharacterized protein (DUF1697 family)
MYCSGARRKRLPPWLVGFSEPLRRAPVSRLMWFFALAASCNPFAERPDISPNKLLVTFFAREPERETVAKLNARQFPPEEFQLLGRELYVFFPEGAGRSKFPVAAIGKMLKESGTARNWNTVLKLFEMAGKSELSGPMHRRPTMEE